MFLVTQSAVGSTDLRLLHDVGEARVAHLEDDLIARVQLVDVAERRQVGRPVAGDRDCFAEAW